MISSMRMNKTNLYLILEAATLMVVASTSVDQLQVGGALGNLRGRDQSRQLHRKSRAHDGTHIFYLIESLSNSAQLY